MNQLEGEINILKKDKKVIDDYFDEDEGGKAQTWIHAESDTDKTEPLSVSHG